MNWWTIQISQWRKLAGKDILLIDTSVKNGSIWGPDWDFLMAYKRGELNEAGYIAAYRAKFDKTIVEHQDQWVAMLRNQNPVAIGCFCAKDKFCHRHLLTQYCIEACRVEKIPFKYHGEFT